MNMNKLKKLIGSNVEWRVVDSQWSENLIHLMLSVNVECEYIEVSFTFKVKDTEIHTDLEITRCGRRSGEVVLEGNDVFSKDGEELEESIYDWLKNGVQYGKDELIILKALEEEDDDE